MSYMSGQYDRIRGLRLARDKTCRDADRADAYVQRREFAGDMEIPNFANQQSEFVFIDETLPDSKRLKIEMAHQNRRRKKVKSGRLQVAISDTSTSNRNLRSQCALRHTSQENTLDERGYCERHLRTFEEDEIRAPTYQGAHQSSGLDSDFVISSLATPITTSRKRKHVVTPKPARRLSLSTRGRGVASIVGFRHTSSSSRDSRLASLTDSSALNGANMLTGIFGSLCVEISGKMAFLKEFDTSTRSYYDSHDFDKGHNCPERPQTIEFPLSFKDIEAILPAEDLAMDLIDVYFQNIHQYIPIINHSQFVRQWLGPNRCAMSPYLLLSFFGIAARFSNDPRIYSTPDDPSTKGDKWFEVVQKFREEFHDVPRLSTVQAEILNLKTLETRPYSRGYFYRAWCLLSAIIRMGKDLGLHRMSQQQGQDPDSISGCRAWQVCLIMDQLMGTGQGREFQLNMNEVDLTLLSQNQLEHKLDVAELRLHNDFIYLVGLLKIMRRCTEIYSIDQTQFSSVVKPQYSALGEILAQWRNSLPQHLRFVPQFYGTLPSHFMANLQITYCIVVCLLHRPWVVSVGRHDTMGEWRFHLRICNDAARQATRLYELMLEQFGASSLEWMIRGMDHAMYGCVVTSMIHTTSLTCPEQEFSEGAHDYNDRALVILDLLSPRSLTSKPAGRQIARKSLVNSNFE